ncbi:hypothetical protein HanIR_Chr15g0765241 [Helianthus annuus]|nr:hypothetical protein HanIR_Chr15g0765241 [Helianthus annuus]
MLQSMNTVLENSFQGLPRKFLCTFGLLLYNLMYSSVPLIKQFWNTKPVDCAGSIRPCAVTALFSPFSGFC